MVMVTIVACLTFITGCKKDDPNDQPEVKSYRVKAITYSYDSELFTTNVEYNADNKITRIAKTKNGSEFERYTWAWNGNKVEISNSELQDGAWIDNGVSQIITYSNGKVSKSEFPINDSLHYSITYSWNTDLVLNELHEMFKNGTLLYSMTVNYIYENGLLTTANYTQGGFLLQKHLVEYGNGKLANIKLYDVFNKLLESSDYIHTGEMITEIRKYHVDEGIQGDLDCTENLAYNTDGKIETLTKVCDGDERTLTTSITYEEGQGNYGDYTLTIGSWFQYHFFPGTYPAEMNYVWK